MEQTFMKEKKIIPLVLSMSLPMMLSMLVNSLYNIVDSYFVAQISEQAMTALSLVYPLQLLETAIAVVSESMRQLHFTWEPGNEKMPMMW